METSTYKYVKRLISQFSHFKPAQLLQQNIGHQTDFKIISPITLLLEENEDTQEHLHAEISARLKHRSDAPPKEEIPVTLLALSDRYPYTLPTDADTTRLYALKNNNSIPARIADYYVGFGK